VFFVLLLVLAVIAQAIRPVSLDSSREGYVRMDYR